MNVVWYVIAAGCFLLVILALANILRVFTGKARYGSRLDMIGDVVTFLLVLPFGLWLVTL